MKKWIGKIFIASSIVLILEAIFFGIYYTLIVKNHEGPMDVWAIISLCIPFVVFVISRIIIEVKNIKFYDSFEHNGIISKISNGFADIFSILAMILLFPILLIPAIIGAISRTPTKKMFKKLIDKGFSYAYKDKKYILQKDQIVINIFGGLTEYYISFDNGKTFVNVEESDLGTSYDRERLKNKLNEYLSSHPVDIQCGDAVPPLREYVGFLASVLS